MYSFGVTWQPNKDSNKEQEDNHTSMMENTEGTDEESTPPIEGRPPKVTPPRTRVQSKYRLKSMKGRGKDKIVAQSLMSSNVEAFIFSLRGGLELIYFDQGGTEGYGTHYLRNLLFGSHVGHNDMERKERLQDEADIVASVARRESRLCNVAQMKNAKDTEEKYKKTYFVRFTGTGRESTKAEKKRCLDSLVQYLNTADYEFQQQRRRNKSVRNQFFVAENYVQSDSDNLEAWDSKLLDEDIKSLMNMLIEPKPGKSFASDVGEMADDFFTPPYCGIAKKEFGY